MTPCLRRTVTAATLVAAAGLAALPISLKQAAAAEETFQYFATIGVPGLASFDISWVDPALNMYFLADRSNKSIDMISTTTKQFTQFKPGFIGVVLNAAGATNNDLSGPNGVLTFNNTTAGTYEIWAGDGAQTTSGCPSYLNGSCSAVRVMSYPSGTVTHVIPTHGAARADELCHDPDHHIVAIANDAEADFSFGTPFVSFISTDTYQIVSQLLIPEATNGIEQCQYDHNTQAFYINLPEVNGPGNDTAPGNVYVISPTTFKVTNKYIIPIGFCAGPQGMALGPGNQILLGCNAPSPSGVQSSIIIDRTNGNTIAVAWGLGGADEAWFNPGDSHYYIAEAGTSGTTQNLVSHPQLSIIDALTGPVDQIIMIPKIGSVSPHSVAADFNTGNVYSPNAGGVNIFYPTGTDSDDGPTPAPAE